MAEEDDDRRQERHRQVAGVAQRCDPGDADEEVAEHAAAQRGQDGQDQDPDDVEALADGQQAAGQPEHEHADQLEHQPGGVVGKEAGVHRSQTATERRDGRPPEGGRPSRVRSSA